MNDSFSSIWLEVGHKYQKKFLVCVYCREWQHLKQMPDDDSHTIASQLIRWQGFLSQWELAIASGKEIYVLGDVNLNYFHFRKPEISSHSYKLRSLIEELQMRILPQGFTQLVATATRFGENQSASCLDHIYANHPEKLSAIETHFHGGTDHKMIKMTRFTKSLISRSRVIRKRCFKNFDPIAFQEAVRKLSWWDIYSSQSCENAAQMLTDKLTTILDQMAPLRNIQVRSKYANWLSEETKLLIRKRNLAQKTAFESKNASNWAEFRKLRNFINNKIKNEKNKMAV